MDRIRTIVLAFSLLALGALAIPTETSAQTPTRPGRPTDTAEQRRLVCDGNNMKCDSGCDDIIDIDNNVQNCRDQCDARYARCKKWAETAAMIVLPPGGGGGINQLKSACTKVGGLFDDGGGMLASCTRKDCDGLGGECFVVCPEGSICTGHTPSPLTGGQTLISILQNGDKVVRGDRAPSGSLMEGKDAEGTVIFVP
jgi:hypothetical protein